MDRLFFIHSSADGQSGCFYVLAPANCAVVSTGMHVSFQIMVFSGYMPGSGTAGSRGDCFAGQQGHGDVVLGAGGHLWWRQPQDRSLALWTFPGSVGCSSDDFQCLDPSISCVFLTLVIPAELLVPRLPLVVQILRLLGGSLGIWSEAPLPESQQFREDPIALNPKSFFY